MLTSDGKREKLISRHETKPTEATGKELKAALFAALSTLLDSSMKQLGKN